MRRGGEERVEAIGRVCNLNCYNFSFRPRSSTAAPHHQGVYSTRRRLGTLGDIYGPYNWRGWVPGDAEHPPVPREPPQQRPVRPQCPQGRPQLKGCGAGAWCRCWASCYPTSIPQAARGPVQKRRCQTHACLQKPGPVFWADPQGTPRSPWEKVLISRPADEIRSFTGQRSPNRLTLLGSWSHECTQGHDGKEPGM